MAARIPVLLTLLLLSSACATVQVSTDYDQSVDFSRYKTFDWLPPAAETGDLRLDSPLLANRIHAAVEKELQARSFRRSGSAKPDFLVGYHLSLEKGVDVRTVNNHYGYGPGWRSGAVGVSTSYVEEYEVGTLLIDVVDAAADRLVWRGTGVRRLSRQTSPEASDETVNRAVAEILQDFPPGK